MRARASEWGRGGGRGAEREREKERERESQAGSALSAQGPMWGLIPQTVGSWPELKSRVRGLTD